MLLLSLFNMVSAPLSGRAPLAGQNHRRVYERDMRKCLRKIPELPL
jgi:hypothetical protein